MHTKLIDLCRELGRLDLWTRLHYVYPYPHVDDIVPLMAEGLILPYLDVPFQHAHPRILKLMKRPACGEKNLERIAAWRRACPDITIRSTFIVGFPGETEAEFEYLLDFLREAELGKLARRIGRIEDVIIDEEPDEDGVAVGRTKSDAPDIDGVCYVTTDRKLVPGDIVPVRITANEEHDLVGREVVA